MSLEQISSQDARMLSERLDDKSDAIRNWIFTEISPFIKGSILELGSGSGEMADMFVKNEFSLRISDPHRANCQLLKNKFEGNPLIKGIYRIDLGRPAFSTRYKNYLGIFNTVVLVNTQSKYYDNELVWINARSLLKERGHLIVLLPAKAVLYEEKSPDLNEWIYANRKCISEFGGKNNQLIQCKFIVISKETQFDANNNYQKSITYFEMPNESLRYKNGLSILAIVRQKEIIK